MDDIYWLKKAVMKQNAMLRRLLVELDLTSITRGRFEDDLDQINALLDHIDTKVIRG